jgi:hypothetical protein
MGQKSDIQELTEEIAGLESRLHDARARLAAESAPNGQATLPHRPRRETGAGPILPRHTSLHTDGVDMHRFDAVRGP